MIPSKEQIVSVLEKVKDPESSLSLLELGIVKNVDYEESTGKLLINIDFRSRNPSCVGCIPIAWLIQKKITDELSSEFLKYPGVKAVEYIDK
ncbi:MAG: DUF59 domain-containing protein [Deltaproteobacteria bacterium]|nr:DUF59 domain-containing protein [Deltaproteobacteria bacterium]MBW2072473.1 DUF59 domain-containing protein [Deltaproteobacteria bacterium]